MNIKLKYGKEYQEFSLPEKNILQIVAGNEIQGSAQPLQIVKHALENPIGTKSLAELVKLKQAKNVVIIVNDVTRPTPYNYILPPILTELKGAGLLPKQIKFIIATGSHRANSEAENQAVFGDIAKEYTFVSHDCDGDLVSLGQLTNGSELRINRDVVNADLRIVTGMIDLHYIAGFSGGRKSILPGVASRDLITQNHSLMTDPRATTGNYQDNPVHQLQMEAAKKVGVDFIVNIVNNTKKEIVRVVAGDLEKAWLEGVKACQQVNMVYVEQQADVTVASAGGFPKDINIYQAQKAIDNAAGITKDGGTIILVAECSEGFGERTFEKWINEAEKMEDIFERFAKGFVLGGHKAFAICSVLAKKEVCLVSKMPTQAVEKLFMRPFSDVNSALDYAKQKHGENFSTYVMPQGGMVFPQLK